MAPPSTPLTAKEAVPYTFNIHENTLTLVWEESADTVTYQLQKLEDSGQSS